MVKYFCIIAIALLQVGCTTWPTPSTGGYASRYLFTPDYQKELAKKPCLFPLSQKLGNLLQKTKSLRHAAACYPARIQLIYELANQIAQEIASGLVVAAQADLLLYEHNLTELIQLNKFKNCHRPRRSRNFDNLQVRLQ